MKEESGGVGLRLCRRRTDVLWDVIKGEVEGRVMAAFLVVFMTGGLATCI
jgi:hypothetical protein